MRAVEQLQEQMLCGHGHKDANALVLKQALLLET
jgi:hypothetical protein